MKPRFSLVALAILLCAGAFTYFGQSPAAPGGEGLKADQVVDRFIQRERLFAKCRFHHSV